MIVGIEQAWQLLLLGVTAFGAATLLPLSSELAMIAALKAGSAPSTLVLLAATLGNVLGSCFNWWIGLHVRRFEGRRWFPFSPDGIALAENRFRRYGVASLLFAWVPLVGDPLTFVAGVLKVPFAPFVVLVTIGKAGRYVALATALGAI